MPDVSAVTPDLDHLIALRRDLHAHPEIGLQEERTSALLARELTAAGWTVTTGLAQTGLVATLSCGTSQRAIGLRADIDALPITEETGAPHASKTPGVMHACGHDGHTAILVGAARALARRRTFDGTVHLIFQPAEENLGGAQLMIADGLFERFACDEVYALHNAPDLTLGHFATKTGPIMAAVDDAVITVQGAGGHAASPHETRDPIVAGAAIVMALQTLVSRTIAPPTPAVVTVGKFIAGTASNVIPSTAQLTASVRTIDAATRELLEERIIALAAAQAASFGLTAETDYQRFYPPTINHPAQTNKVHAAASLFAGQQHVHDMPAPAMGSEDFAYMLEERPGCYFLLGAQETSQTGTSQSVPLHHPAFDFNDAALPIGAAFWVNFTESLLAPT
ncbi:MAG: M20 aminoacylase family protein [Pseudomonadota bacterium]